MIGVTARARPGALGSRGAHRGAAGGRSPRTPRRVDALDARPTFAAGRGVSVRRGDPRGGVSEERGRCRGAPGVATAAVPIAGGATSIPQQLWCNPIFRTGFIGWFSAQVLKVLTSYLTTRRLSWQPLFDSGGMPSSHSSLCMSFTTAVGVIHGLGSSIFAICFGFSAIVMYDAANVRLQAGKHAQILNKVVEQTDWLEELRGTKLKEVLGHSKTQVLAGFAWGILVGLVLN